MEMENSMVDVLENALFGEGGMVEAFVHGLQARASAASGSSDIPVPDDWVIWHLTWHVTWRHEFLDSGMNEHAMECLDVAWLWPVKWKKAEFSQVHAMPSTQC